MDLDDAEAARVCRTVDEQLEGVDLTPRRRGGGDGACSRRPHAISAVVPDDE